MIATQLQQIYYGANFKTVEEINFLDDLAAQFTVFMKNCVDQGLIENKRSWSWDPDNQVETVYFFSNDMSKTRDFQKALLESDMYQEAYQAMKAEGYNISVGMVNFIETDDTRFNTIK